MPEQNESQPKRSWTPNKARKVRSKKSFDQERIKNMTSDTGRTYKGELDPRKKDDDKARDARGPKLEDGQERPEFLSVKYEGEMGDVHQHF